MKKINWAILCPVPKEQRPFYEYIKRKQSIFLGFITTNETKYTTRFFTFLIGLYIMSLPLVLWAIPISYYPFQTLIFNLFFSFILEGILYLYFFFTWIYAGKRLVAAKVWYEESGWYDGKIWIKPPSVLKHERLLYHYQLMPLIARLTKTLQFIFLCIILLGFLLFLITY